MAGAVDLDPDTIRPATGIAYQDDNGNWHAGPDAVKNGQAEQVGEFISGDYAKKARGLRRNANMIKNIMREHNEGEGTTEKEAREIARDVQRELRDAETEEERRDIWRQYVNS